MSEKKVGELLLEQKLISVEHLQEALDLQKIFPDLPIGQLLCKLGFVKESDLSFVLDQKNKRLMLTDIFLKGEVINQQKLSHARQISKQNDIPIEKALLKLGYIDEEQMARAVSSQYDLPFVSLKNIDLDVSLAQYISAIYAQKQMMVPISKIGNTLTLAMAAPLSTHVIRELEDGIRLRIIPAIATQTSIYSALKRLYNSDIAGSIPSAFEEVNLDIVPDSIDKLLSRMSANEEPEVEEEIKKVTEKDSVIVKLVNKIVYDAYMSKASDIHIEPYPGKKDIIVRTRIDGQCSIYQQIPYKYKFAIPSRIKIMAELDIAERRKPQDGKIDFKKFGPLNIDLRVATMPTVGGLEDVVIRVLTSGDLISFHQLGLSNRDLQVFDNAIKSPYGLILLVGPTGSGKTTTLHSGLAIINQSTRKIWTAEDPVEITQSGLRQVQVNPRIGFTFAAALRSFLRLDPDVIMVGEMRDEETASIAIEASLTGHLVFSTLHTNSAPETVTRLLEMGLDPYGFSDSLLCVMAQRLVRRLCDECMESFQPEEAEVDELIEEYGRADFASTGLGRDDINMSRAVGCDRCGHSGYRGRSGIYEVLECTPKLKGLIKRRADTDSVLEQAKCDGMTTLKQDGILKVFKGLTDIHEVRRVCIK
ncbi:MAG: pilus assembly protein PilB [Deltaproteobacteria bacterium HGW-Deltaproteobacteria-4]|nr:MAG: pilus assembly protein PilB [Deltaproteobacteria bacterium HGW-Deltaproteobacteria-4]